MSIEPVAIIGLAVRAPGAADAEEFWANLAEGRNCIHRLTDEQLLAAGEDPARLADPDYVRARPLLDDVGGFDDRFFGVSPRESELRNPQHRLFLELCSTALQHGGYHPAAYEGNIGVYGGCAYDRYAEDHIRADPELFSQIGEMVTNVSNNVDYLSTYVSYRLGLRGPSLTVRTACSTSLVATHLACQALRHGDCDIALAGGVEIEMPYGRGYVHVPGGIDSRDGLCRPLDANATGTVFGNGGGVVVLKLLSDALADGDNVIAVIRGSAMSNDGVDRPGFTAPSPEGQSRAIAEALIVADVDPATISYVELHGTGTVMGDPVEVHGLNAAFQMVAERTLPPASCAIGSVKSNLGHLGPASGVVGLIKVALSLANEMIPPTINVEEPNPELGLDATPFHVAVRSSPWPRTDEVPRRAGTSSFGFGGTNVHVVLEEAPPPPAVPPAGDQPELLVWSAMDDTAERELRRRLAETLSRGDAPARDLAFTSQVGRRALPVRSALTFTEPVAAGELLADPGAKVTARGDGTARAPVFVFPGQGSQQPQAATMLARRIPLFGERVRESLTAFSDLLGIDLVRVWRDETDPEVVAQTVHAQPLLFSIELALAETLGELGVIPARVTGHSVGELVAATLAGVFETADAIRVVARRAELIRHLPAGAMLAVSAGEEQLSELLPPGVAISAVNGPRQVVIGGREEEIGGFQALLADRGIQSRRLPTSHAFHTPLMEPARAELTSVIADCKLAEPRIPLVSAALGAPLDSGQALSPEFWAAQLVEPVRFLGALETLAAHEPSLLLEVGPGRALTSLGRRHAPLRSAGHRMAPTLAPRDGRGEWHAFLDAIAEVWVHGATVDWEQLPRDDAPRRVPLPAYPYQRRHYWLPEAVRSGERSARTPLPEPGPETPEEPEAAGAPATVLPGWRPAAVVAAATSQAPGIRGHAVVFLPADATAAKYALTAVQLAGYRAVPVTMGEQLELRRYACVVRPDLPGDLAELMTFLADGGVEPARLVHARALGAETREIPADDPALQDAGFWSILELLRASSRLRRNLGRPVPVSVITDRAVSVTGAEPLVPARALATGLIRSAALEYGAEHVQMIDVGAVSEEVLAAELAGPPTPEGGEAVVALRGRRRWLPDRTETPLEDLGSSLLSRGGTYVITGGLGALGLAVARGLADSGLRPRLILLSRRAGDETLPDELRDELAGLESAGAKVRLAGGDVADAGAMRDLFERLRREYGRIDGILHAAGLPGGGLIEGRAHDAARAVLRPKVTGSVVLRDIAAALPGLRFLVFFSSRAALNGLLGSADYAAANAFQDALALASTELEATVMSVNWPAWRGTGMATLDPTAQRSGDAGGQDAWRLVLDPADWVVAEHRVAGDAVLPGTAYLDLLVRAVRARPGVDDLAAVVIEDLTLLAPLTVDRPTGVSVRLTAADGGWDAVVESDRAVRNAVARVSVRSDLPRPSADPALGRDWAAYTPVAQEPADFEFGPRFDCVTDVRAETPDGDVIAGSLRLPEEFEADLEEFAVHPALLDRVLAMRLSVGGQLPFTCRRAVVHGDLPGQVTARLHTRHLDDRRTVFDAELYDMLGRATVTVEGFTKVPHVPRGTGVPAPDRPGADTTVSGIGLTSGISVDEGVQIMIRLLAEGAPPTVAIVPAGEWAAQPAPAVSPPPREAEATAPPGGPDTEESPTGSESAEIARLWGETLGLPTVAPDADFLDLGGDSLTAVQLISRIRDRFGVALSVAELFDHSTPDTLAAAVAAKRG